MANRFARYVEQAPANRFAKYSQPEQQDEPAREPDTSFFREPVSVGGRVGVGSADSVGGADLESDGFNLAALDSVNVVPRGVGRLAQTGALAAGLGRDVLAESQDSDTVSPFGILLRRALGGAQPKETKGLLAAEEISRDLQRNIDERFPKPQAQAQTERELSQATGVMDTLGALVRNPVGSLQLAGESLASSLPAIRAAGIVAGSGLASGAAATSAGEEFDAEFQRFQQTPAFEALRRAIGDENVAKYAEREKARRIQQSLIGSTVGGAATAGVTSRIGLNPIDQAIAGRAGALSSRVPATIRETAGEAFEGGGTQAVTNLFTGADPLQDVAASATMEAALGGLTAAPVDMANAGSRVAGLLSDIGDIGTQAADLTRQAQARATADRILGRTTPPQTPQEAQTDAGAGIAEAAIQSALAARPVQPAPVAQSDVRENDELDRLLVGALGGVEDWQTVSDQLRPNGDTQAGVRSPVGSVPVDLPDGTYFIPGDPAAIRQRLADAGVETRGVVRTIDGQTGVRFGANTREQVLGVLGGGNIQAGAEVHGGLADLATNVPAGTELAAGRLGLGRAQSQAPIGMAQVPDSETNRGTAQPTQAEAAVDVAPPKPRNYRDTQFDERKHDLLDFIAMNGGLDRAAAESEGVDPSVWKAKSAENDRFFGKPAFKKGGMSIETLREKLAQSNFAPIAQSRDALDLVFDALGGREVVTPEGATWRQQQRERDENERIQRALSDLPASMRSAAEQAQMQSAIPDGDVESLALAQQADRDQVRDDILSGLPSVHDQSPAQRVSAQSLGADYTDRLLSLMGARKSGAMTEAERDEYTALLEQDRETGKVNGRPMVGVGNKTGYVDALSQGRLRPVQVFTDADQFKLVNDKLGHDVGDEVIRLYGNAMIAEFGQGRVWHRGGDEFLADAETDAEADAAMARVAERMRNIRLEVPLSDGRTAVLEGIGVSYGKGATEKDADEGLKRDKERRKRLGLRADRQDADSRSVDPQPDGAGSQASRADSRRGDGAQGAAAEGVSVERQTQTDVGALVDGPAVANDSGRDSANRRDGQAESRIGRETGGTVDEVRSAVSRDLGSKFLRRLESQPWFNLVESLDQLPPDVRKSISGDDIAGFVLPDGRVFIIADNVGDNATGIVLHEVGVHFGMSGLPDFPAMLAQFKRLREGDDRVAAAYKRAEAVADRDKNGNLTADAKALLDEEAFAYYVEQNWNVKTPLMTRIKDAIARLLNRLGVPTSGITDALMRQALDGMVQSAREAADMAARGAVTVRDGKIVYHKAWHGSPHDFDKFRLDDSTIGTGEGAQAFGHGLYFAGRKELGEYYRDTLSRGKGYSIGGKSINGAPYGIAEELSDAAPSDPVEWARETAKSIQEEIDDSRSEIADAEENGDDETLAHFKRLQRKREWLVENGPSLKLESGRLYEVELAPDESDYLDWDKPLSEQSEKVRQSVYNLLTDLGMASTVANYYASGKSGAEVYREISKLTGGDKAASARLKSERVPGIRYLDGSSRGKGEGSHNYVIFDDKSVSVVNKYSRRADGGSVEGMGDYIKSLQADLARAEAKFEQLRKRRMYDEWDDVEKEAAAIRRELYKLTGDSYGEPPKKKQAKPSDDALNAEYVTPYDVPPDVLQYEQSRSAMIADATDAQRWARIVDTLSDDRLDAGPVTIYRAVMGSDEIRPGDWVTTDRKYADEHNRRWFDGRGNIAEEDVDGRDVLASPTGNYEEAIYAPRELSGPVNPARYSRIAYSRKVPRTAAQEAALAKAGMPEDNRTLAQRGKDYIASQWGKVRDLASLATIDSVFDRFHRMSSIEQELGVSPERSAYISARLAAGLPSIMEGVMMYGAPKWEGGVLTVDENTVGLLDALKPVKDDVNAWLGWMVGRRARALKAQGRENLMTDDDIAALLSLANGRDAEFQDAALKYLRIKNAILDVAEKAGLIDPAGRAVWDSVEYIPFYRQDEADGDTIGPGTRQGLAGQNSGIRSLKGGKQNLADPLGNIVRNFTRLIDASLKNNAMLEAVDEYGDTFFEKVPMSGTFERVPLSQVKKVLLDRGVPQSVIDQMPQGTLTGLTKLWAIKPPTDDDVVRVMRNGKAEYYRVPDKSLLAALTAFKIPAKHWSLRPFKFFKQLLTIGVTSSPDFMARNFVRDSLSSWVISDDKFRVGWDSVRGVVSPLLDNKAQKEMMFAGGSFIGGQFYSVGSEEATANAIRRALRDKGLKSKDIEAFMGTIARTPLALWDKWQKVGSYMENANRNAIYENAIKEGRSKKEAAYLARDLMDFSMHGNSQFVQFLSDVLPFFNARLQGLYKLYRQGGKRALRKALLMRAGMIAGGTMALMAWNIMMFGDGYDELEEWDKDTYWHIAPGTKFHIRVPKPFELGVLFATIPERVARAITYQVPGGDAGDRPRQTIDSFLTQLGGTLAMNPIPQGVMPIVEQWANKSFFTGRPIENMGDEKLLPEARSEWYTSDTAKVISDVIGNKTGLSPKRIEHLWNGYTGTIGAYLLDTTDALVRQIQGAPERPELAWSELPLFKAFYRGDMVPKNTRYMTEFYELKAKAEQVSGTIKEFEIAGRKDEAAELEAENAWLLGPRIRSNRAKAEFMHANVRKINKARDELADIRKQIEGIVAMPGFTDERKRREIDALAIKRNQIAREITRFLRQEEQRNR